MFLKNTSSGCFSPLKSSENLAFTWRCKEYRNAKLEKKRVKNGLLGTHETLLHWLFISSLILFQEWDLELEIKEMVSPKRLYWIPSGSLIILKKLHQSVVRGDNQSIYVSLDKKRLWSCVRKVAVTWKLPIFLNRN